MVVAVDRGQSKFSCSYCYVEVDRLFSCGRCRSAVTAAPIASDKTGRRRVIYTGAVSMSENWVLTLPSDLCMARGSE
jgi:hypothetical protein